MSDNLRKKEKNWQEAFRFDEEGEAEAFFKFHQI